MPPTTVTVDIGQPGEQFLNSNGLPPKSTVDRQPAGLNFYRVRWSTAAPGTVVVNHGQHSFDIPFALTLLGTEDAEALHEGVRSFDITAGVTAADTIQHDEARRLFLNFIQTLTERGWKPAISYNYPRLKGEQAYQYFEEDYTYTFPPDYRPSLDQWMNMTFVYWSLFADGVFLDITFRRDRKRMDPEQPGAYLLSFTLNSKEEEARSHFQGEKDRANWKDLWVDKIKELKKERYAKEEALRKRGFDIDTNYEEPKIHPDDPVEP